MFTKEESDFAGHVRDCRWLAVKHVGAVDLLVCCPCGLSWTVGDEALRLMDNRHERFAGTSRDAATLKMTKPGAPMPVSVPVVSEKWDTAKSDAQHTRIPLAQWERMHGLAPPEPPVREYCRCGCGIEGSCCGKYYYEVPADERDGILAVMRMPLPVSR
jgi:hypothetical protein